MLNLELCRVYDMDYNLVCKVVMFATPQCLCIATPRMNIKVKLKLTS